MSIKNTGTLTSIRYNNIDALKILASVFVVILHVNGFTSMQFGLADYSFSSRLVYYATEAIAYPSIHLFVMAGSFLMIRKPPKVTGFLKIYLQTISITLFGLVICAVFLRNTVNIIGILKCLFPFSFRAYWFVSEYFVLMIISPFLNKAIEGLSTKRLIFTESILMVVLFAYPFIIGRLRMDDNWGSSYFDLFIFLYLSVAIFERVKDRIKVCHFALIYVLTIITMVLSAQILIKFGEGSYGGHELFLYNYKGPFVIASAFCIYGMFIKREICIKDSVSKIISVISSCTLGIYLYHMHPIFKTQYTNWGILSWMNVDNPMIYSVECFGLIILVYLGGVFVALALNKWATYVMGKILNCKLFRGLNIFRNTEKYDK